MPLLSTGQIETFHDNIQYTGRLDVCIHLILPTSLLTLYRVFRAAGGACKHADVHRGEFAAGVDARRRGLGHMPPQTQEYKTAEGAD